MKNVMNKALLIMVCAVSLSLAGCNSYGVKKETVGIVTGGALGGWAGSQIGSGSGQLAAVAVGTLLGATIGGSIGASMDELDRIKLTQALESNRTHASSAWANPDTGAQYTVTPQRTYNSQQGPCRDYTMEVQLDGRSEIVHGTACRSPDGRWVNS